MIINLLAISLLLKVDKDRRIMMNTVIINSKRKIADKPQRTPDIKRRFLEGLFLRGREICSAITEKSIAGAEELIYKPVYIISGTHKIPTKHIKAPFQLPEFLRHIEISVTTARLMHAVQKAVIKFGFPVIFIKDVKTKVDAGCQ